MGLRARWAVTLGPVMAAVAVTVAGCGGSVHLTGPPPPPPGHQAPANAVSGFVRNLLAGGDPLVTCGYVDHNEEGNCLDSVGSSHGGTGTWRPGRSVVSGNEALVAVELANVCFSSCSTNVNPDAGLPRPGQSFAAAFQRTQQGTGKDYAWGCVRIGGRWYVELGITGII